MNQQHGFTLTELLITVAIIGIMAAIALPQYTQTEAAKVSEATSQLNAIRLGEDQYKQDIAAYLDCVPAPVDQTGAACWSNINVDDPQQNAQRSFNYSVTTSGGGLLFCAVAKRRDGSQQNKTVCLDNTGYYSGIHPNGPNPATATNPIPGTSGCVNINACHP